MSPLPQELHQKLPAISDLKKTSQVLKKHQVNTVCHEAKCPNRLFCFASKSATFLALGKNCSRACRFCATQKGALLPPDPKEPEKIAGCAKDLNLQHIVITMVTRDDLTDGGASHLVKILKAVKKQNKNCSLEILTSDFQGDFQALDLVLQEKPDIFNHNLETIKRLTPKIRDKKASYQRSLEILSHAKKSGQCRFVKSGLMVGLGEKPEEVKKTLEDLYMAGCDIATIGQYLPPNKNNYPLQEYISQEIFYEYETFGKKIGFKKILSSPLVRSSLNAAGLI